MLVLDINTDIQSSKKSQFVLKRVLDFIISLFLILILSPLIIAIIIAIRLTSKGSALFLQERIGKSEKRFYMYKFRSMYIDKCTLEYNHSDSKLNKSSKDRRVTPVGSFLRKSSLDELPQLFNILRGDMSFVGPRPLVPDMLSKLPQFSKIRSSVKPGLTGLWQIKDRKNNTKAEYMMKYDIEYIRRFSISLDFEIILKTIPAVIKGEGAV